MPAVLRFVEPWVSSEDIPKGTRWGIQLASELEGTHSGIICLVHDNLTEPWLDFEAGALSKSIVTLASTPSCGLPLILWTPSRHNSPREVRNGQITSEFHPGV